VSVHHHRVDVGANAVAFCSAVREDEGLKTRAVQALVFRVERLLLLLLRALSALFPHVAHDGMIRDQIPVQIYLSAMIAPLVARVQTPLLRVLGQAKEWIS
jgi:hypothetical protein